MSRENIGTVLLRAGVAFALLYPPLDALSNPYSWIGYFPPWVHTLAASAGVSDLLLLHIFGALEIALALWILSGWNIVPPSLAAAALLCAIVVFNPSQFEVIFRDLSIAAAALALVFLEKNAV